MGKSESEIIDDLANLENIQWWHRNLSRGKGFRINGFMFTPYLQPTNTQHDN
jgi:type III restriction enzyme